MAAWCERDDAYNQRLEDYGQHVRVDAFYECSLDELIDEIAAATRTFDALADETAELTDLIERRAA